MGFIAKAKERFGKAALALEAGGVLGTVALASLATGDVSAATGAEAEIVETTRWLGLSVLGWIGAGLTAAFGVGTLYFRDIRLAGATIAMVILTGLIVHFGL